MPGSRKRAVELPSDFAFPPVDVPFTSRSLDESPPHPHSPALVSSPTLLRGYISPKRLPEGVSGSLPPAPIHAPTPQPRARTTSRASTFFKSLAPQPRRRTHFRKGSIGRDPPLITSLAFDSTAIEMPNIPPLRVRHHTSFNLLRFANGLQPQ